MRKIFRLLLLTSVFVSAQQASAQQIKGKVTEAATNQPIPGATVIIDGTSRGVSAGTDGTFILNDIPPGTYTVSVTMLSFKKFFSEPLNIRAGTVIELNVSLEEEGFALGDVVVTARRSTNTEVAMISQIRTANVVVSSVSAQQITRTQARDASEVIKRIPGISIIENRFIIARGLSQRYNNVWINNNAVPSSEADSRAFSFDMIPSGQIENMMIVKSPAPELPADFTGGFVKIATKSAPEENSLQISYGININTMTHFKDFKYAKGSRTDFLGFDNGFRGTRSVVPKNLDRNASPELVTDVTANGFNNDWLIRSRKPIADQKFSMMINHFNKLQNGGKLGVVAALNYSNSYLAYQDITNARFSVYDWGNDRSQYMNEYADDQYSISAKVGGMLNLIWMISSKHRLEFRNIANQQGRDRYTFRSGYQNSSSRYDEIKEEYFYNSRGTYSGQFSGIHDFSEIVKIDWTVGYSYANRNQPDRRQINLEGKEISGTVYNSIGREFTRLDENIYSAGLNYNHTLGFGMFEPTLKAGVYVDYRSREYNTRYFTYQMGPNLPNGFRFWKVATEMMLPEHFAADIFFITDGTKKTNDYIGDNLLKSGYLGLNIPFGKFNIYAGARYENNLMSLTNFVTLTTNKSEIFDYKSDDFFPSVNATYNINKTNLVRIAYGKSINRQEFREVSPSVYYDFDLFSDVKGNTDLRHAYIQNFDLRYEIYPSSGEMISFALFYKKFKNPIEWTFIDTGGSYLYTFENADGATSYGVELDVKKSLNFIGLSDWSISFNGSLIQSEVKFAEDSQEHDRPMQGQSPYLVNAGLFYQHEKLSAGLMYNIIGKRIVGIGRTDNSQGNTIDNNIPDMFEMPRHAIDLSLSYKFGKCVELSAGAIDILAAHLVYKQFPKSAENGKEREQTTKEYRPGRNFSMTIKLNF